MEPIILDEVFDKNLHRLIMKEISIIPNNEIVLDEKRSRITSNFNRFSKFSNLLLPVAKEIFQSDSLLPSYAFWARYLGKDAFLERHKDLNACTYTIDYCINQFIEWPIFIEGHEIILEPNQAVCFMGEDQEHWRGDWIPGNVVDMMFFHYVEPDHWWYTGNGGQYIW